MNSTLMKIAIAYIAGIGTYALFQNYKILSKVDQISMEVRSFDTEEEDSTVMGGTCACENTARYNVDPRMDALNVPISNISDCRTMVSGTSATPTRPDDRPVTVTGKGAWFSKVTLDLMFCHKSDANGVFVYKAMTAEGTPTYVIEAARDNRILTTDDGSSYIYYSRSMCPTICGACGM